MAPNVIDLCLDDSPPPDPAIRQVSGTEAAMVILDDESDSGADVSHSTLGRRGKRQRLSPPSPAGETLAFLDVDSLQPVPSHPRSGFRGAISSKSTESRTLKRHSTEGDDPIVFSSSPRELPYYTKRKQSDSVSQLGATRAGIPLGDKAVARWKPDTVQHPPTLTTNLSARTAALLADLSTNRPSVRLHRQASETVTSSIGMDGMDEDYDKPQAKERAPPRPLPSSQTLDGPRRKAKELGKEQKQREKEAEKERKRKLKEEKAREKLLAAELAEVNKANKGDKKASTAEMIVDLPTSLAEATSISDELVRASLLSLDVETTTYNASTPRPANVIKWRRKVRAQWNEEAGHWEPIPEQIKTEKHALCLLSAKELVDMVSLDAQSADGRDLEAHFLRIKCRFEGYTIIYLIEGLETWMRKNKNNRNRAYQAAVQAQDADAGDSAGLQTNARGRNRVEVAYIDEDLIEDALLRLQVVHGCLIHHTGAPSDSAHWVAVFTQHISTIPYRTQRMALDTAFCTESGQIKTGDTPADTYVKMLQEIVRITASVAQGIAAEYPSVRTLVVALRQGGPGTLADVRKLANKDGTRTDSCIGPAISRRVYKIFTGTDPTSNDV
ncbi:MAG: hypothetical protein M1833_000886 [Piccolia ochrophora]|nr:MAG: hypothetical protein M1833_000886 [Piccolia ochrophora]